MFVPFGCPQAAKESKKRPQRASAAAFKMHPIVRGAFPLVVVILFA